jgi:anti-sigma regulatory factor (Ser/Thr protein kinase)
MVIASDGLLSRLGGGTEFEGIKVLRRWQSGRDRNGPPDRNLTTDQLAIDDELFALLEWNGWDREMEFEVHEQTEYERAVAALDAKIRNVLGGKIADGFKQALAEVVNNAWRHGYAGQKGRLKIRFREEAQCFRVEVEDMGKGGITEKAIKKGQSGFAIIHSNCANVHVRNGRERGSVVELTIEKSPNPGSDDRK